MGGRRKVAEPGRGLCRGKRVARPKGKSVVHWGVRRDAEPYQAKSVILCCREKPLASCERPVPETDTGGQVENTEATGELWLRNSANCPRNFGRRGASAGEGTCCRSWWGSQRAGGSDCLLKTQVHAKS